MSNSTKNSINSDDSSTLNLSTVISCSSGPSVQIYEERLRPTIDSLKDKNVSVPVLVREAEQIVQKFSLSLRSEYTYKGYWQEISVQLDKVMLSMLNFAERCGGENALRYVASAIVACSKEEDQVIALEALGTIWLTHFLFKFRIGRGYRDDLRKSGRHRSLFDKVMKRDNYTCALTGFQDLNHPESSKGSAKVELTLAQIIRWPWGAFDKDHNLTFSKTALTSFDILVNFTQPSIKTPEEFYTMLKDPSNCITLEMNAHYAFSNLYWCMEKTEREHVYAFKMLEFIGILRFPENNIISFEDHTSKLSSASLPDSNGPVALPNPRYIEIHAVLAEILHTSGAGAFFDQVLREYWDHHSMPPAVRSWPEFEKLMEAKLLRDSVRSLVSQVASIDPEFL